MNVMMISSLNTYTTNMKMQMKWQQKKSSGDFTADGAMSLEDKLLKGAMDSMDDLLGDSSKVSSAQIRTKLMSGKKLSSKEMDYLRENDPELYKKAKAIEMEREAYERELKQCKTKEEVQKVKMAHATAALAQVKNIESNPNIPEGQKLALMMEQLAKSNALGEVERKFVQSGEYKRLPSEEEKRQAEEDLKEAQEAERGIEDKTDDTPQEVAKDAAAEAERKAAEATEEAAKKDPTAEAPADPTVAEGTEKMGAAPAVPNAGADRMDARTAPAGTGVSEGKPISTDVSEKKHISADVSEKKSMGTDVSKKKPMRTDAAKKAEEVLANTYDRNIRRKKAVAAKQRMTRAEAEVTPEARKVKRARAKAAYTKTPHVGDTTGNMVDVKK